MKNPCEQCIVRSMCSKPCEKFIGYLFEEEDIPISWIKMYAKISREAKANGKKSV